MSFHLSTGMGGPYVLCNCYGWGLLFNLALEYGWKPRGTKDVLWLPSDLSAEQKALAWEEFEKQHGMDRGPYFYNDGRLVDEEDCKAMLLALESAKSDIANGNLRDGTYAEQVARSENRRVLLDKMIAVCQVGHFYIL